MTAQNELLTKSAGVSLISAMSLLLQDTDTADITIKCGDKEWRLHTAVLAIRSSFFKETIANIKEANLDMEIEIENLDPDGMQQVINFMYGKPIEKAPFSSLLDASDRFQMDDMKKVVEKIGSESINSETALEIGKQAERYNLEPLLQESAKFIVKENIEVKEDDVTPKLTISIISILRKALEDRILSSDAKDSTKLATPGDFITKTTSSSLISAMYRLLQDTNTTDFTVKCGEQEWRLHSPILSTRSPFFKGAIANNMAEQIEMKMEIKDLDPSAMQEVISFMYGKPIGNAPFGELLEASERFQMNDMKKDVIKIGSESITTNSVVEIGKLSEIYNIDELLQECAEFIVENEVDIQEDDVKPKLTTRILSIFKKTLKKSKQNEKELEQTKRNKEAEFQRKEVEINNAKEKEFENKKHKIRNDLEEIKTAGYSDKNVKIDNLLRSEPLKVSTPSPYEPYRPYHGYRYGY